MHAYDCSPLSAFFGPLHRFPSGVIRILPASTYCSLSEGLYVHCGLVLCLVSSFLVRSLCLRVLVMCLYSVLLSRVLLVGRCSVYCLRFRLHSLLYFPKLFVSLFSVLLCYDALFDI